MTTPNALSYEYRVTSLSESGTENVVVNLVQKENQGGTPLSLVLSDQDGREFFPGDEFTVTLTKKE